MALNMRERKSVTNEVMSRYKKSTKKEKMVILDEFCNLTGYNRSYGARVLRLKKKPQRQKNGCKTRSRPRIYGLDVLTALKKIWATLDGICGKRIKAVLPEIIEVLEKHNEIKLDMDTREKLMNISAATIDRLLSNERKKFILKGISFTKPGTLLKSQIPIRTFTDWNEDKPGFVEIDLVSHDGGKAKGDYGQTLDVTDVASGWTETAACKNKAQIWVFEALEDIRARIPFPLLGIDSDNGSEFINHHLVRFCETEKITFTRSRPYRKNDNCYVEQKNWTVVRRFVGYRRYDSSVETDLLNELYSHLRLYTNFFMPSMKLIEKTRTGSRVKKRYDDPKTPYKRLLDSDHIADEIKTKLRGEYDTLNPVRLKKTIYNLQNKLYKVNKQKSDSIETEAIKTSVLSTF